MGDSAAFKERLRTQAQAEMASRQKRGVWGGIVKPHVEYQQRPIAWIVEKLGIPENTIRWSLNPGFGEHVWDGTRDPIARMLEALGAGTDTGIESATGTGKTWCAAAASLWFLGCFENAIVQQWAPREDQLLLNIWKEIAGLWPKFKVHFPEAQLLTGKIRMRPTDPDGKETWAATAMVAGVGAEEEAATRAQGTHAAHLLIITEETPGINPAIMKSLDMTRTGDHNIQLALGNPDHRNDPLHKFCERDHVVHIRISALDHPNIVSGQDIIPAAIGRRRLLERTAEYGKGTRLYQSRIRGISPSESATALISWDWCIAAANRWDDPEFRNGPLALGIDVAWSENGDKAAIARWQGRCLTEVEAFPCPNPNALGRQLAGEIGDPLNPIDPRYVGIDPIGGGSGTVNELRGLGIKIRHLGGGNKAVPGIERDQAWSTTETEMGDSIRSAGKAVVQAERFVNLRSQIWYGFREDLRLGRVAIPNDEELFEDLTTPEYETKNGVICVEKKEEIVKRLGRSPDKGDAAVYGAFVRCKVPPRPRRKSKEPEPRRRGDQDFGLEKLVAQHERDAVKRRKEMLQRLRSVGRKMS